MIDMPGKPRMLIYVQHLLGIGHLMRTSRIAGALSKRFDVVVASGGMPIAALDIGGARLVQLMAVKAADDGFGALILADGSAFDKRHQAVRRDQLLGLFAEFEPHILLIEAFPFGRRQMRFELLPLLELARSQPRRVLIASSVRDILQEQKKSGRAEETAELVNRYFDLVLVHGSEAFVPLAATFPLASEFNDKIVYTGMVGSPALGAPAGIHDIIVSVGGGAVGAALVQASLAASRHCDLAHLRWLVLTGPNMPDAEFAKARALRSGNTDVERFVPDLAARMRNARVSVSQAGYNTVADILAGGCACVLVPFATGGETEQTRRAELLAERGLAIMLSEADLNLEKLALAIIDALAMNQTDLAQKAAAIALDGADRTAEILFSAFRSA